MKTTTTSLLAVLALSASVIAQDRPPNPGDPNRPSDRGGDRGGDRGRFNYEDIRKQMADRLKTSLKVSDEEWSVLQPLIEKVQGKLRDSMGSRFGGFGGFSGRSRGPGDSGGSPGGSSSSRGSSDPNRPVSAGSAERDALRTALENENASPEELKARLAAVRDVRQKSAAELAAAREDLKKVLTVRQEAVLVAYGILE